MTLAGPIAALTQALREMMRIAFKLALCLLTASALSTQAHAQESSDSPRIGLLQISASSSPHLVRAFTEGMRTHGFVEGRNVRYEIRYHGGDHEKMESQARALVSEKVAAIFVMNTPTALAAQKATRTVPVVFATVGNPVEAGLVRSLAAPGANITGFALHNIGLRAKRVELLHDLSPGLKRLGVLHDSRQSALDPTTLAEVRKTAATFGKDLLLVDVGEPGKFDGAFAELEHWSAQMLLLLESTRVFHHRRALLERAAKLRLPLVAGTRDYAEAGALISYGADYADQCRRAADYVARILKGTKPADLPVQQPTKFEMVINLRTAKTIGTTIPPQMLLRADRVIE